MSRGRRSMASATWWSSPTPWESSTLTTCTCAAGATWRMTPETNVPWPASASPNLSPSASQVSPEPAVMSTSAGGSQSCLNSPVSRTAILTPSPSSALRVRCGSAAGRFSGRAVVALPPWIRGSPVNVTPASPTKTWFGATFTEPWGRPAVALRTRASASSTSCAVPFPSPSVNSVDPDVWLSRSGFQSGRCFCTSATSAVATRIWRGRRRKRVARSGETTTSFHAAGSLLFSFTEAMAPTLSDRVGPTQLEPWSRLREAAAIVTVLEHPLARAEEAVRLAQADARAARRLAASALAEADDAEARSTAERALGLAAIELGDAAGGAAHLRRAVRTAESAGLSRRAAEARMSLSLALTLQGATAEALDAADRAAPDLDGWAGARLGMQRALILQKLGRLEEALEGYRAPLAVFRRRGDELWEARLLCNRGVLQVYRGALGAARADFRRAEELHESIGQALAATQVRHNLGWLAARRGDVPEALGWYDRVEAEYRGHGVPLALLLMDRAEVLLSARLAAEARDAAERAAAELESAGL